MPDPMPDPPPDTIDVEIRVEDDAAGRGPGTLAATILTYGTEARTRPEVFARGSLFWPPTGIEINSEHRGEAIMTAVPAVVGDDVTVHEPIPDTPAGRRLAADIAAGRYAGMSIEFRSIRERRTGALREIHQAALVGAAVTARPDYATTVETRTAPPDCGLGWM